MIFFHGAGSNGSGILNNSAITAPLLNRGYALIAPNGLGKEHSDGTIDSFWNWTDHRDWQDDYGYLHSVISNATGRFAIDPNKIIIAGHSNGATMVWYLACRGFDLRIKFFAPINGTPIHNWQRSCSLNQPEFNLLHMNGASDIVAPVEGRMTADGTPDRLGAHDTLEGIAKRARCDVEKRRNESGVVTVRWQNCIGDSQFNLMIVPGGHTVPRVWANTMLDWYEKLNQN